MRALRIGFILALLGGWVLTCAAQELAVRQGATEIGVFVGGGTGLGHSSSAQFTNAGVRLGKVLTGEHGAGFLRGNFEYAADVLPRYLVFQNVPVGQGNSPATTGRQTVYGAELSPVILKWNFTGGKKIVPFAAAEASAILTTKDIPAGDTSTINFSTGISGGLQLLRGDRHAVSFSGHLLHISNASIGDHNPSYNITLQFRLGYQWWK
jgi:hypothetical protein